MNGRFNSRGVDGERIAKEYLVRLGYQILTTNFFSRWGELDIVAIDPNGIVGFIEVKSYRIGSMVSPLESVTPAKIKRIEKTIAYFLMKNPHYQDRDMRIEVIVTDGGAVCDHLTALK